MPSLFSYLGDVGPRREEGCALQARCCGNECLYSPPPSWGGGMYSVLILVGEPAVEVPLPYTARERDEHSERETTQRERDVHSERETYTARE
jgi:hypothetical protein